MAPYLILPSSDSALVFGMEWLPLIGRRLESAAYRTARQYKASHLVFSNTGATAVGLADLPTGMPRAGGALRSAAQCLACLFSSGTVALMLEVESGRFWVAAVHDGAVVTGTDRLYPGEDVARAAMEDLKQAYPRLAVLGAPGSPPAPSLRALDSADGTRTRLVRARSGGGIRRTLICSSLAMLMVAPLIIWGVRPRNVALAPTALPAAHQSPATIWRRAVDSARQGHVVHGYAGTRLVLDSFYELPGSMAGWSLTQAACSPEGSGWRCDAMYRRRANGAGSDVFLDAAPSAWRVSFAGLDQARVSWPLSGTAVALVRHDPHSVRHDDRHLLSQLQALSPAFTRLELGQPVALRITPPRDRGGRVPPRPPGMPRYVTRSVRIMGPLRSAGMLAPLMPSIEWSRVTLASSDVRAPSLTASRFVISFEGVLHESEPLDAEGVSSGRVSTVGQEDKSPQCMHDRCHGAGPAGASGVVGDAGSGQHRGGRDVGA
ncbi:MAG TPA: hypothetical protein VFR20_08360 [Burkholderiaceae bacterium]|nr:hypothetical protein [Burkholderiaceae bacterium]